MGDVSVSGVTNENWNYSLARYPCATLKSIRKDQQNTVLPAELARQNSYYHLLEGNANQTMVICTQCREARSFHLTIMKMKVMNTHTNNEKHIPALSHHCQLNDKRVASPFHDRARRRKVVGCSPERNACMHESVRVCACP